MINRVSGTFFDASFTGRLALDEEFYQRDVVFDDSVKTWAGYVSRRQSVSLRRGVERDGIIDHLRFHRRHVVFLGDHCLGWIVNRGNDWVAEPINHSHVNPDMKAGVLSQSYQDWSGVYGFFTSSLPEPCRAHLRTLEQKIEHEVLAAYHQR